MAVGNDARPPARLLGTTCTVVLGARSTGYLGTCVQWLARLFLAWRTNRNTENWGL